MNRSGESWRTVWLVITLLCLVTAAVLTRRPRPLTYRTAVITQEVVGTAAGALNRATALGVQGVSFMVGLVQAEREVTALRAALAQAQLTILRERAAVSQDGQLRAALGLRQELKLSTVAAQVIGESPISWWAAVTVNRGIANGVRVGAPVMAPAGIIGRVLTVSRHTATVMLLSNAQSGVGAVDARTGALGVLLGEGEPDRLAFDLFSQDAQVKPGDAVLTSGIGGVFPHGLPLGVVTATARQATGLVVAEVRPSADPSSVQTVLIVVGSV